MLHGHEHRKDKSVSRGNFEGALAFNKTTVSSVLAGRLQIEVFSLEVLIDTFTISAWKITPQMWSIKGNMKTYGLQDEIEKIQIARAKYKITVLFAVYMSKSYICFQNIFYDWYCSNTNDLMFGIFRVICKIRRTSRIYFRTCKIFM